VPAHFSVFPCVIKHLMGLQKWSIGAVNMLCYGRDKKNILSSIPLLEFDEPESYVLVSFCPYLSISCITYHNRTKIYCFLSILMT
jgi:hypothetical protein